MKSEYAVFCVFFNLIINMKCKKIHKNVFAQGIHDGVTLANYRNYQSLDLQLIDTFWEKNLVVCCGFPYSKNKKDSGVSDILNKKFNSIMGHHITYIMGIMVADRADIWVSTQLGLDEREACGMHGGDKLREAATGKLTRSKKRELWIRSIQEWLSC